MLKSAFIPVTPFRINDEAEYHSPAGQRKRSANETLSLISGAGAGMLGGAALGILAGKAIGRIAPGRFGVSPSRYIEMERMVGNGAFGRIAKTYARKGMNIPASIHLPIGGIVVGAAAGMFPAEYMARKKMQMAAGIRPVTTPKEYIKTDVAPAVAGAFTAAGMGTTGYQLLQNAQRSGRVPRGQVAALVGGSIGAGLIVEKLIREAMERKNRERREQEEKEGESDKTAQFDKNAAGMNLIKSMGKIKFKPPTIGSFKTSPINGMSKPLFGVKPGASAVPQIPRVFKNLGTLNTAKSPGMTPGVAPPSQAIKTQTTGIKDIFKQPNSAGLAVKPALPKMVSLSQGK